MASDEGDGSVSNVRSEIEAMQKSLADLTMLVQSVVEKQRESMESSVSGSAPGTSRPEAGTHHPDATGRTVGGTGRALGQNMSSTRVGSTSSDPLGLNSSVFVGRSTAGAASFGSIGDGRGGVSSQPAIPPPSTAASEWWGRLASGNTLIPGAGNEAGESFGGGPFKIKVPKAPAFDGTEVSYPSWSQNFLLSARNHNLYEQFDLRMLSRAQQRVHVKNADSSGRGCFVMFVLLLFVITRLLSRKKDARVETWYTDSLTWLLHSR